MTASLPPSQPPPIKEDAPCCMSKVDDIGRPPLGFCSPECIRRPAVWAALAEARAVAARPKSEDQKRRMALLLAKSAKTTYDEAYRLLFDPVASMPTRRL